MLWVVPSRMSKAKRRILPAHLPPRKKRHSVKDAKGFKQSVKRARRKLVKARIVQRCRKAIQHLKQGSAWPIFFKRILLLVRVALHTISTKLAMGCWECTNDSRRKDLAPCNKFKASNL